MGWVMSSKTAKTPIRSAAWRISLWATLAFAVGTLLAFMLLNRFVANDIQRRTDTWITGELGTLGDVAEHTPKDALYNLFVGEVAELAEHEVPNRPEDASGSSDSVFFLQEGADGKLSLWVGSGSGDADRTVDTSYQTHAPFSHRGGRPSTAVRNPAADADDANWSTTTTVSTPWLTMRDRTRRSSPGVPVGSGPK